MEKLFDSELKVMRLVWDYQPVTAKQVSLLAAETLGWNKNTTYTVLKKLVAKGYVQRDEPDFVCTARVTRDEVRQREMRGLMEKLFDSSRRALFSALLGEEKLSAEEAAELRRMIEERE